MSEKETFELHIRGGTFSLQTCTKGERDRGQVGQENSGDETVSRISIGTVGVVDYMTIQVTARKTTITSYMTDAASSREEIIFLPFSYYTY